MGKAVDSMAVCVGVTHIIPYVVTPSLFAKHLLILCLIWGSQFWGGDCGPCFSPPLLLHGRHWQFSLHRPADLSLKSGLIRYIHPRNGKWSCWHFREDSWDPCAQMEFRAFHISAGYPIDTIGFCSRVLEAQPSSSAFLVAQSFPWTLSLHLKSFFKQVDHIC